MYTSSVCRQQSHVHEHVELLNILKVIELINIHKILLISDKKETNMETTSESEQLIDYLRV